MPDLLGLTSIVLISLVTLFISIRLPTLSTILFVALFIRISLMLIGHYLTPLPDSTADAVSFERIAWERGQNGFYYVIENIRGPNARFISWIIAIPYSLFGRSILMAQSISLFFGIGCILIGWKLSKILWNDHTAKKVAWTIALFPSLVLYSVLILREVYVCFFLLIALYGVVSWTKFNKISYILMAFLGFVGATFFHGAMIIGASVFLLILGIISFKKIFKSIFNRSINLKVLMIFVFVIFSVSFYFTNKIHIPYLGTFDKMSDISHLERKTKLSTRGVASYPEWTKISSPYEFIYKAPIRALYFIYSPFPWDIKKTSHIIGLFDGILYMYLTYLIFLNRKIIWKDPALKIISIILISYIVVFAIGVGNFGTGIRHRSKFAVIFILLAAPLIKKLIFFKKNKV